VWAEFATCAIREYDIFPYASSRGASGPSFGAACGLGDVGTNADA
jgi:hypothetical protein